MITRPRTGEPHHGPSYHARHHGRTAPRAVVPRLHNERRHDGVGTTGMQEARFASADRKRHGNHAPRTPNGVAFSCRERAASNHVKKPTISRAQRSTATPGWAARRAVRLSGQSVTVRLPRGSNCLHTRHVAARRGNCREARTAERRGMNRPREATAATLQMAERRGRCHDAK